MCIEGFSSAGQDHLGGADDPAFSYVLCCCKCCMLAAQVQVQP